VRTFGEYIRRLMGAGEIPAFRPTFCSVSRMISSLILLKSWNFCPGMCKNSPHSSVLDSLSVVLRSPLVPLVWGAEDGRLMSWRTSGLRVTIPVPRGRLREPRVSTNNLAAGGIHTSLFQRCFLALNSFRLTVTLLRRFVGDLSDFGPIHYAVSSRLRPNKVVTAGCNLHQRLQRHLAAC
jgi:hypothetical protein